MRATYKQLIIFTVILLAMSFTHSWAQESAEDINLQAQQDMDDSKKCLKKLTEACPGDKFGPQCFAQVMPKMPKRCETLLGKVPGAKVHRVTGACQEELQRLCPVSIDAMIANPTKVSQALAACIQKKKQQKLLSVRCERALGGYK